MEPLADIQNPPTLQQPVRLPSATSASGEWDSLGQIWAFDPRSKNDLAECLLGDRPYKTFFMIKLTLYTKEPQQVGLPIQRKY